MDEMIGKTFEKWTVISFEGLNKYRQKKYLCKCECGTKKIVVGSYLRNSGSKSCGCIKKPKNISTKNLKKRHGKLRIIGEHLIYIDGRCYVECLCDCGRKCLKLVYNLKKYKNPACSISCSQLLDIKNKKFGRLTVLEHSGFDHKNQSIWKCKCECENIIRIQGKRLINGNTKSCGCLNIESCIKKCISMRNLEKERFIKCLDCEIKIRTFNKFQKFCSVKCRNSFNYKKSIISNKSPTGTEPVGFSLAK